jgi:hypothetical protein
MHGGHINFGLLRFKIRGSVWLMATLVLTGEVIGHFDCQQVHCNNAWQVDTLHFMNCVIVLHATE